LLALLSQSKRRRDCRGHERRVDDRRKRDEEDAIGEVVEDLGGHLQR
jgi:hypothetical protein